MKELSILFGSETGGNELLWRGVITGLCIGIVQYIVLLQVLPVPQSVLWIGVLAVGWGLGWLVKRAIGVDLSPK